MPSRFIYLLSALALLGICLFSCSGQNSRSQRVKEWMKPNGKVKVLSTIEMIDDVVKQIGGEHIDGLVLIHGELDPHSYQLVKGDDEKFAVADIIFYNGLTLEPGPSLKKTLEEKEGAVGLGDRIQKEDPSLILHYNGQVDPHIWMDVSMWRKTIPHIVDTLSASLPEHRDTFVKNAARLELEFDAVHEKIRSDLQKIPEEKRYLVTSHDAFNYFARSYLATDEELEKNQWQQRFAAPEGLSPDSQLSTSDIKQIVDHLGDYNIQVLFPESNLSRDSISKIVEAGKGRGLDLYIADCPLYADAMGPVGSDGDTYLKMVQHNANLIGLYLRDYNPRLKPKCN
ncbi:MAG: zinc ABC transporter substrate-binding protein [Chlamydiota bacterium]|nr:zinc ABC transporter substrate-binding protein [Chlamydiota bacterium]